MAGVNKRGKAGYSRRENMDSRSEYAYIDGNVVRKQQPEPVKEQTNKNQTSHATKQNRERALQMNLGYVLFLTVAAIITVFMCVNYLKLLSKPLR